MQKSLNHSQSQTNPRLPPVTMATLSIRFIQYLPSEAAQITFPHLIVIEYKPYLIVNLL